MISISYIDIQLAAKGIGYKFDPEDVGYLYNACGN
jgi:hypothetical protein